MRIFQKILYLLFVLLAVSFMSFFLSDISSIDSARAVAHHIYGNPTPEQIETVRKEKGLDKPFHLRYELWLRGVLRGDFGISYQTNNPVSKDIAGKFLATVVLVAAALFWILILTVSLSLLSVSKRKFLFKKFLQIFTILGISIPSFWLGYLLLTAFAVCIPIFKVVDFGNLKSIILPSFTLAIPITSAAVRMLKTLLLENMKEDYVIYARARGLSDRRILWKYVLKNALPPMVTLFFQNIGMMIGGSAIVESVFSWQGMGSYFVSSVITGDVPAITGCVLILGVVFVVCNEVGEIVNGLLNPHMRSKKRGAV